MTKQADTATPTETGRRYSDLVARVVTELRGLNFDFEFEEEAAERIIEIVSEYLVGPAGDGVGPVGLKLGLKAVD